MYIKIINSESKEIGCIEKKYLVPLGLRHQIARVIVYARTTDKVLLQQRSLTDDSCPGMWDTSASGHVDGHEEHRQAAARELLEELAITADAKALHYVGSFDTNVQLDAGRLERETHVYCLELETESNEFTVNSSEVEQAAWIRLAQPAPHIELTKGAAEALELFKEWLVK